MAQGPEIASLPGDFGRKMNVLQILDIATCEDPEFELRTLNYYFGAYACVVALVTTAIMLSEQKKVFQFTLQLKLQVPEITIEHRMEFKQK